MYMPGRAMRVAVDQRGVAILAQQHGKYVPIALKIAPDLDEAQIALIAATLQLDGMDGVIATNTTFSRTGVEGQPHAAEAGGLSGAPLRDHSTAVVRQLAEILAGKLPIIAVGGISSGADAAAKIAAGASLVQLYTGFIYRGPTLVREAGAGPHGRAGWSYQRTTLCRACSAPPALSSVWVWWPWRWGWC